MEVDFLKKWELDYNQSYNSLIEIENFGEENTNKIIWSSNLITTLFDIKMDIASQISIKKYKLIILNLTHWLDRIKYDKQDSSVPIERSSVNKSQDQIGSELSKYFSDLTKVFGLLFHNLDENGFLAVILSGPIKYYHKLILDHIFTINNFVNEILISDENLNDNLGITQTSSIFVYSKNQNLIINPMYKLKSRDPYWHTMHSKGPGGAKIFRIDGVEHEINPPVGSHWKFKQETIDQMIDEGKIILNSKGNPVYLVEGKPYILDNNWLDINGFIKQNDYYVINNEVIERLVGTFSNDSDHILHIFMDNKNYLKSNYIEKRVNTFITNSIYESFVMKSILHKNKLNFQIYTSGIIEKEEPWNTTLDHLLNIFNAQKISGFDNFHGIINDQLLHINSFNQTFDWNDLKKCIVEFQEIDNLFSSILIIADDFQSDDMWDQIIQELIEMKITVKIFTFDEYFKANKINIDILEKPITEISVNIEKNNVEIKIKDLFFLNTNQLSNQELSKLNKSNNFSHFINMWKISTYANNNNLINEILIGRENKKDELEIEYNFIKQHNEKRMIVKVYDITGSYKEHLINLGSD
ncbi:MAG: hypothetical protein INQ03_23895 [Candidatus Heimdallarchaeota archaeon]|nr:hypothetical protein [Candidatus Heimdallarchaeota archaeon]